VSYETYQRFASDSDRVRREQERQRRSTGPTAQEREQEVLRNAEAELRAADIQQKIQEDAEREVQARLAQDPEYQAAKESLRRQQEETAREFREVVLGDIFSAVIADRGVAVRNTASENLILSWVSLDERPSRQWFVNLIHSRPDLANQLQWQSPSVLNPTYRLEQDRKTFAEICRKHSISNMEANFGLLREVLQNDFTVYNAAQAITSGAVQLSPATAVEIEQWRNEAAQARQNYLRNEATSDELRYAARTEAAQQRQVNQQAEADRQLQAGLQRESFFPPLPEVNQHGEKIDSAYLVRISNTNLQLFRAFVKKHGAANVTARLRGLK
jgi:hypothetical protein